MAVNILGFVLIATCTAIVPCVFDHTLFPYLVTRQEKEFVFLGNNIQYEDIYAPVLDLGDSQSQPIYPLVFLANVTLDPVEYLAFDLDDFICTLQLETGSSVVPVLSYSYTYSIQTLSASAQYFYCPGFRCFYYINHFQPSYTLKLPYTSDEFSAPADLSTFKPFVSASFIPEYPLFEERDSGKATKRC